MSEKKTVLDQLKEEVEIPETVRKKADAAFAAIRQESEAEKQKKTGKKKRPVKRVLLIAAALTVVLGAAAVGASVYMKWSKSLSEGLHVTEETKQMLEDSGMVNALDQSVTDQGITVTLEQTMVDNYFAYLIFRVEGYSVEKREQPDFEHLQVLVDGKEGFSQDGENNFAATGDFFSGIVTGADLKAERADGKPLETDENGDTIYEYYTQEDGSMEYWVVLDGQGNKGEFLDKPVHIELENLGTVAKAEYLPDIEGKWVFDGVLKGSDEVRVIDTEISVEELGLTVTHAELSPISAYLEYKCTGDGAMPIAAGDFPGVKMKDGKEYPIIWYEPGVQGNRGDDTYVVNYSFDRILDVDEIESLLFLKSSQEGEGTDSVETFFCEAPLEQ